MPLCKAVGQPARARNALARCIGRGPAASPVESPARRGRPIHTCLAWQEA